MKSEALMWAVPLLLMGVVTGGILSGCEVGNPNNVSPVANANFSGYYANPSGGDMVANHTGAAIMSLTLSQSGNQLQAIDSNGLLFTGTLGDVLGSGSSTNSASSSLSAAFTLQGSTTAGAKVNVSGQIQTISSKATMTGTWAEPTLYSSIYGVASVPSNNVNSTTALITVNANPSADGTASGGGTYTVGTSIQISATANAGFTFVSWNDSVTSNPRSIIVPAGGATYTANFQ